MFKNVYQGKKVLVTGHTGFKGTWLSLWLLNLGAEVYGLSKEVFEDPSHFSLLNMSEKLKGHHLVDIRNFEATREVFEQVQPEIVFHLAAEAIVKTCLDQPKDAFDVNLGGTVNILESIRATKSIQAAVMITSDKCYENVEWDFGYRENDQLGGKDPYSASKACAEICFSAYFRSYFHEMQNLGISTARAGNVIGGGDWARFRIIPDAVRAIESQGPLIIRAPRATRPWQLVLEPLSGYLNLASELYLKNFAADLRGESFNFGPPTETEISVDGVLKAIKKRIPILNWQVDEKDPYAKSEAGLLKLNCDKALRRLNWRATLNFEETIELTSEWYNHWLEGHDIAEVSTGQISLYASKAKERGIAWAQ